MSRARLPISVAKFIALEHHQSQVVVVTFDKWTQTTHVVTYGVSAEESAQAAEGGNRVKKALGWPEDLCKEIPTRYQRAIEIAMRKLRFLLNDGVQTLFVQAALDAIESALKDGG